MDRAAQVFISVCEDSADVHAAALVRAARERQPGVEFYGLTGPRLRELGVETVYDFASHAAMLAGVLGVVGRAYEAIRVVEQCWRQRRPDLVVLLDSPELHLKLAARAKRLGIPVLYYIAPQTWASRAYRKRQIVRDIDRLACILPFEEKYFKERGVNGVYVGHPMFDAPAQSAESGSVTNRFPTPGVKHGNFGISSRLVTSARRPASPGPRCGKPPDPQA